MTAALAQAEIDRNHFRRALETALRDLQIITGSLAALRARGFRGDLGGVHGQAEAGVRRAKQALQWEPDA